MDFPLSSSSSSFVTMSQLICHFCPGLSARWHAKSIAAAADPRGKARPRQSHTHGQTGTGTLSGNLNSIGRSFLDTLAHITSKCCCLNSQHCFWIAFLLLLLLLLLRLSFFLSLSLIYRLQTAANGLDKR